MTGVEMSLHTHRLFIHEIAIGFLDSSVSDKMSLQNKHLPGKSDKVSSISETHIVGVKSDPYKLSSGPHTSLQHTHLTPHTCKS